MFDKNRKLTIYSRDTLLVVTLKYWDNKKEMQPMMVRLSLKDKVVSNDNK